MNVTPPTLSQRKPGNAFPHVNVHDPIPLGASVEATPVSTMSRVFIGNPVPEALGQEVSCNKPKLKYNHTKRSLSEWDLGYGVTVLLQEVVFNALVSFTLAFLTVAFAPSLSYLSLFVYAYGYAAIQFFAQMTWSAFTGAYGNPVLSLIICIVYSHLGHGPWDGKEFWKVPIFWLFQLGGTFAGVFLAIMAFGFPLPMGHAYGKPVVGTLLGDPLLPPLDLYQALFYETMASIVIFTAVVIAHTTEHIQVNGMHTAMFVATGYFTSKILFGWYTGAVSNPFYWLVTAIISGNYSDPVPYILGPVIAAGLVLIGFFIYTALRSYLCRDNDGVCISPDSLKKVSDEEFQRGLEAGRRQVAVQSGYY